MQKMYEKQIGEVENDIRALLKANPELQKRANHVISAPCIGFITAVTVIAEPNGFNLIRNKKQLISYAGYDIVEKQSGSSIRGKSHISHKDNKHIRKAMHMPALNAIRHIDHICTISQRTWHKNESSSCAPEENASSTIYTLEERRRL
jgi:transposase